MRYAMLIYTDATEDAKRSKEEHAQVFQAYMDFNKKAKAKGAFLAGEALQPVTTATTGVGFARCNAAASTKAASLPYDVTRTCVNGNAHFGGVVASSTAPEGPLPEASNMGRLTAPAVEAEDAVGLGNSEPAFDVGEF